MKAIRAASVSAAFAAISLTILTTACVDSQQPQSMLPRAEVSAPAPTNTPAPSAQTQAATGAPADIFQSALTAGRLRESARRGAPADIFQSALTAMNALSSYRAEMDWVDTEWGSLTETEVQAEVQAPDKMGGDMTTTVTGTPDLGEPYEADQLIAAALEYSDAYETEWMSHRINVIGIVDEVSRGRVYLGTSFGENVVGLEDLSDAALKEIEVGESVEFACVIGEYAREAISMTQCGPAEHGADSADASGESNTVSITTIEFVEFVIVGDDAYITQPDPNNPQNQFWVQDDPANLEGVRSLLTWFEAGSEYEFTPNELVGTEDLNSEETYRLRGSFGFNAGGEPDDEETNVWVGTSDALIRKISIIAESEGTEVVITISFSRFNDAAIQIKPPADFRTP